MTLELKGLLTDVEEGTLKIFKLWIFYISLLYSSKKQTSPKELGWNHFSTKWEQFSQKSLVHKTLFNTLVYGSNETRIIMHNLKKNWNELKFWK